MWSGDRRQHLGLRLQVLVHPNRAVREPASIVRSRGLMVLARLEPSLACLMHDRSEFHPERGVPDDRLRADTEEDLAAAIVSKLVALAVGLDRDPLDPRARGSLSFRTGCDVGWHNPDVLDQPVHESLHRLGQSAAAADRFPDRGAGSDVFEHGPVEGKVSVQPVPDRIGQQATPQGQGILVGSLSNSLRVATSDLDVLSACLAGGMERFPPVASPIRHGYRPPVPRGTDWTRGIGPTSARRRFPVQEQDLFRGVGATNDLDHGLPRHVSPRR